MPSPNVVYWPDSTTRSNIRDAVIAAWLFPQQSRTLPATLTSVDIEADFENYTGRPVLPGVTGTLDLEDDDEVYLEIAASNSPTMGGSQVRDTIAYGFDTQALNLGGATSSYTLETLFIAPSSTTGQSYKVSNIICLSGDGIVITLDDGDLKFTLFDTVIDLPASDTNAVDGRRIHVIASVDNNTDTYAISYTIGDLAEQTVSGSFTLPTEPNDTLIIFVQPKSDSTVAIKLAAFILYATAFSAAERTAHLDDPLGDFGGNEDPSYLDGRGYITATGTASVGTPAIPEVDNTIAAASATGAATVSASPLDLPIAGNQFTASGGFSPEWGVVNNHTTLAESWDLDFAKGTQFPITVDPDNYNNVSGISTTSYEILWNSSVLASEVSLSLVNDTYPANQDSVTSSEQGRIVWEVQTYADGGFRLAFVSGLYLDRDGLQIYRLGKNDRRYHIDPIALPIFQESRGSFRLMQLLNASNTMRTAGAFLEVIQAESGHIYTGRVFTDAAGTSYDFSYTASASDTPRSVMDAIFSDLQTNASSINPTQDSNGIIEFDTFISPSVSSFDQHPQMDSFSQRLHWHMGIRPLKYDWEQRRPFAGSLAPRTQAEGYGYLLHPSPERLMELTNGINRDLHRAFGTQLHSCWWNIHINQSDLFIRRLFNSISENVDPNIAIILEDSNETWNNAFPYNQQRAAYISGAWEAFRDITDLGIARYQARRIKLILDILDTTSLPNTHKVYLTYGSFMFALNSIKAFFFQLHADNTLHRLKAYGPSDRKLAVSIAPYLNLTESIVGDLTSTDAEIRNDIITQSDSEIANGTQPIADFLAELRSGTGEVSNLATGSGTITLPVFDCGFALYEGGQGALGVATDDDSQIAFTRFKQSTLLQELYRETGTEHHDLGVGLQVHFHLSSKHFISGLTPTGSGFDRSFGINADPLLTPYPLWTGWVDGAQGHTNRSYDAALGPVASGGPTQDIVDNTAFYSVEGSAVGWVTHTNDSSVLSSTASGAFDLQVSATLAVQSPQTTLQTTGEASFTLTGSAAFVRVSSADDSFATGAITAFLQATFTQTASILIPTQYALVSIVQDDLLETGVLENEITVLGYSRASHQSGQWSASGNQIRNAESIDFGAWSGSGSISIAAFVALGADGNVIAIATPLEPVVVSLTSSTAVSAAPGTVVFSQ